MHWLSGRQVPNKNPCHVDIYGWCIGATLEYNGGLKTWQQASHIVKMRSKWRSVATTLFMYGMYVRLSGNGLSKQCHLLSWHFLFNFKFDFSLWEWALPNPGKKKSETRIKSFNGKYPGKKFFGASHRGGPPTIVLI